MKNDELTELREQRTWTCRIGTFAPGSLPIGADLPMRQAVQKAFHDLLGIHPAATFSGWGDKFDEHEMAVIEDRLPEPEPDTITALQAEVARLREENEALREALVVLHHAVCGETGFANAVREESGKAYPWPALDIADEKARKALENRHD